MSGQKDLSIYKGKALVFTTQEEQVNNEVYSTLNTEIEIKQDQFHKIYPGFYPRKELTNQIGSGMGIEHVGKSVIVEVFGDVEEFPDGRKVRKIEGYRCHKSGRRRRPDGTWQQVDEMYEFNWVSRAKENFLDDEELSQDKRKYTFPDSVKQRRRREKQIESLKKFAAQRASTGADLCIIRALTGMSTSFKANEIAVGTIVVSQIIESNLFQAKKAQSEIDNIRMGGNIAANVDDASKLLIGETSSSSENFQKIETQETETIEHDQVETKPFEKMTTVEQLNSLLKDPKIIEMVCPGPDGYDISAAEYYSGVVESSGGNPDAVLWAVNEILKRVG